MDAREHIKIWEKMYTDLTPWLTTWQEIGQYILPRKSNVYRSQSPAEKQTAYLYDGTAIKANDDLAAWLQSNLTSMAMDWYSLTIGDGDEEVIDKEGELWLEDCRKRQFAALRASNFSGQIHEAYLDLGSFCQTAMLIDELPMEEGRFAGLRFLTLQPGEYAIEEGPDGETKALFRVFSMSAQAAYDKWGEDLSDAVKKYRDKEPSRLFDFLHCVYPNDWFGGKNRVKLPEVSVYIDKEGKKLLGKPGGYHEFPFAVFPWHKASGEKYGRGPGWTSLPDVKTLNKAVENTLKQWAKAVDPPVSILYGQVLGSLRLTPAGRNYVRSQDAIKPIESGVAFDIDKMNTEDLRTRVREYFHADKIRMLPPPEEAGKMTAFEVSIRYEMMQKLLGPAFNYIINYGLDKIIERTFSILYRAKQFKQAPQSVVMASQSGRDNVKINYESPLARAQRMHEVEAITKLISFIAPLSESHPEIWDNIDMDEGVREAAKIMGIPKKMLRAKDGENSVKNIRAAREQARAQAQQQEALAQGAEIAAKGIPALNEMNPDMMAKLAEAAGAAGGQA